MRIVSVFIVNSFIILQQQIETKIAAALVYDALWTDANFLSMCLGFTVILFYLNCWPFDKFCRCQTQSSLSLSLLSNVWENFAKENLYIGLCLPNRYCFPIVQQQALNAMNRNSYYMHFDVERMWVTRNKNISFTWI